MRVEPSLLGELRRYGAVDSEACFDCGTCSAICPLSAGDDAFPRRMIRYARLGKADHLVASKELWLCHHCGECSETCPRQANPAEFMAASRRFAVARLDPSGLSRRLALSGGFTTGVMVVLAILFSAVLIGPAPSLPAGHFSTAAMLHFMPFEALHIVGLVVLATLGLLCVVVLVNMFWILARAPVPGGVLPDPRPGAFPLQAAVRAVGLTVAEILDHRRQRTCSVDAPRPPLLLRRWVIHLAIMGGFLGLGAATGLDYLFKDPNAHVPPWSPIRLLGILSGLAFTYGTTVALVQRFRHAGIEATTATERYYSHTRGPDLVFLFVLWTTAVTGFALTIAIYVPTTSAAWYGVFLLHVVLAMELLVLLPFTKFAHAIFRPAAIWFWHFRRLRLAAPPTR
jgi:ferredoxin